VQEAHTVSHFQRAVLKIGNYLIILAVALVAVIIAVAIFRGDPILTTLQFALVLTVAAIPVAMPTVLSVTMAVGARLLAKKEAIMTRLSAIEELAGVDILCSDKTGTLTQNKLTLGDPFSVNDIPADQVILNAALASRADDKDTIDLAVLGGLKSDQALKSYQVVHFQPFDPVHKRTEAAVKGAGGKEFKVAKGAPQVILELSANAGEVKSAVDKAVNEFAARGLSIPRCGARRGGRQMAVSGRAAALRSAPRRRQGNHCDCPTNGCQRQDGDRRCAGHRPGNRQETGDGHEYPRCQRLRRFEAPRDGGASGVNRESGRLRAGLPRTQIPHCRCPAAGRPHRRHDRRRGERRPGTEEGRLRSLSPARQMRRGRLRPSC
jgi:hypothetical protein